VLAVALLVGVIAIGTVCRFLYVDQPLPSPHVDEAIVIGVIRSMDATGSHDTSWLKPTVPEEFRYPQYNFASYLAATFWWHRLSEVLVPHSAPDVTRTQLRLFSSLFGALVLPIVGALAWNIGGPTVALLATTLCAINPLLVQDSYYVRPETFFTCLTVLVVWLTALRTRWSLALAGFATGLLIACKISGLTIAWIPLVGAISVTKSARDASELARRVAVVVLALAIGIVIGVPAIVTNWHTYVSGIQYLRVHYAGAHPPHSPIDGGPSAHILWTYFRGTTGTIAAVMFAAGGAAVLWQRRWIAAAVVTLPVVVTAALFAQQQVFFERNLSHVVPLYLIGAAIGLAAVGAWLANTASVIRYVALGSLAAILVWVPGSVSMRVLETLSLSPQHQSQAFEARLHRKWRLPVVQAAFLVPQQVWMTSNEITKLTDGPVILKVVDYGDPFTARYLAEFEADWRLKRIGVCPSLFPDVPASTLQTNLSPSLRYFVAELKTPAERATEAAASQDHSTDGPVLSCVS
jgi:hypothetical protein